MPDDTIGLEPETAPADQPSATDALPASEGVIPPKPKKEETPSSDDVSDLMPDGTSKSKDVHIPYKKFEELNERTKILEQLSPLLTRIQKEPELVERLMKGEDRESIETRLAAIENERKTEKRQTVEATLKAAVKTWPDFRTLWPQMQPLVAALDQQGIPYVEAVERSYFAVNPEAAKEEARLTAQAVMNRQGVVTPGMASSPKPPQPEKPPVYAPTEADLSFARAVGIDPKLYEKHGDWIKAKGLDTI